MHSSPKRIMYFATSFAFLVTLWEEKGHQREGHKQIWVKGPHNTFYTPCNKSLAAETIKIHKNFQVTNALKHITNDYKKQENVQIFGQNNTLETSCRWRYDDWGDPLHSCRVGVLIDWRERSHLGERLVEGNYRLVSLARCKLIVLLMSNNIYN